MVDWARLKELYRLAGEHPAAERAAFLESACGNDRELLHEVESLLAAGDAAGSFLDAPPDMVWAARAAAMAGTSLGHYRLDSLLGRGGMGLVYRATDMRLGRTVAVKIVRPELASTPDARNRLLREAKAASSLKHPNIVTVYDAGEAGGRDFLVMEFVEGQTLAERLTNGPMRLDEAISCALHVAAALEAAHAAGILHRDLKPQNVMLENAGVTKVVDFGLAKLDRHAASSQSQALETHTGALVGTAAYMSPEQAEGRPADARSDIFSFGALLYEMLSGRRAFPGASPASTLASVLRDDPEPLDSPAANVIARCLEKDPARRFQTAAELRRSLETVRAGKFRLSRKWWRYAAALAVLVVGATGIKLAPRRRPLRPEPPRSLVQVTKDFGLSTEPALSRDGRMLAYASDRGGSHLEIWVQPVSGGDAPRRLTSGSADRHEPSFSPDGTIIGYRSEENGGGIWTVPVAGGAPRLLAPGGRRPRYSPDGKWIAYWTGTPGTGDPAAPGSSHVFIVPAAGGEPRQIEPGFVFARSPIWAPDSRHILFTGMRTTDLSSHDWWVASLNGDPAVPTGARSAQLDGRLSDTAALPDPAEWRAETSSILFSGNFSRVYHPGEVSISNANWKVVGRPILVTTGSGYEDYPAAAPGAIAFVGLAARSNIWSLQSGRLSAVTRGSSSRFRPSISADGNLLIVSQPGGILAHNLKSGTERVVVGEKECLWARLTPDGSRVYFAVEDPPGSTLYSVPSVGGSPARHFTLAEKPWDVAPDGGRLLAMSRTAPRSIISIDMHTGGRSTLLAHPKWNLYWAAFSADGTWVAFTAKTAPDQSCIYAAPVRDGAAPDPSQWIPVTGPGGFDTAPRWSPDGRKIYFFSDRDGFRCIWVTGFDRARPSAPQPFHHFHQVWQSLNHVPVSLLELAVSRDRVVFDLDELSGNIWLAR